VPICRGSLAWLGRQTHNLDKGTNQMRNLEISGAKRSIPEVAGSNPAPEAELTSVSANGTIRASITPQNRQSMQIDNTIDNKNKKGFPPHKLTVEDRRNLFFAILNEGVQA
jgi:hypothetical protein